MSITLFDWLLETYEGESRIIWIPGGGFQEIVWVADLDALYAVAAALAQGVLQLAYERGIVSEDLN